MDETSSHVATLVRGRRDLVDVSSRSAPRKGRGRGAPGRRGKPGPWWACTYPTPDLCGPTQRGVQASSTTGDAEERSGWVRLVVAMTIGDQAALGDLATAASNPAVRRVAVKALAEQATLVRPDTDNADPAVRAADNDAWQNSRATDTVAWPGRASIRLNARRPNVGTVSWRARSGRVLEEHPRPASLGRGSVVSPSVGPADAGGG